MRFEVPYAHAAKVILSHSYYGFV